MMKYFLKEDQKQVCKLYYTIRLKILNFFIESKNEQEKLMEWFRDMSEEFYIQHREQLVTKNIFK